MSSSPLHAATGTTPAPDAPIQIRARGRSFLALVLSPERPLSNWLESLDAQIARSAAFFAGKPVILDLALLHADDEGLDTLQARLIERGIRIIGVEGGNPEWPALAQWDMPTGLEGAGPVAPLTSRKRPRRFRQSIRRNPSQMGRRVLSTRASGPDRASCT